MPYLKHTIVFACFFALLGIPLVFRPARSAPPDDARQLIIVTPHREMIRNEFAAAFDAWHDAKYGERVNVVWSQPGGTSEIRKMLMSQFTADLESGETLGGNADLVFGGGEYEHQVLKDGVTVDVGGATRHASISVPVDFDPAWLETMYGPNEIGSNHLYDPEGYWFGTALSGFGIVYNNDVLDELGVRPPVVWTDLCDPRLFPLADIVAQGHAITIHASGRDPESRVACGDIGGFTLDTTDLQVGLGETNGSGMIAISWLHDNGDGTTTVSIVILPPAGTASVSTADGTDEAAVIREFLYLPNPFEVESGTTVIWANEDLTPHTVTATQGAFDSEFMAQGDTFSFTFDTPGTFDYFCSFHPRMRATITVR